METGYPNTPLSLKDVFFLVNKNSFWFNQDFKPSYVPEKWEKKKFLEKVLHWVK